MDTPVTERPFILRPAVPLHHGLAQLRLRHGRCPRCSFHPDLIQRCGVCVLWMTPEGPGIFYPGFPMTAPTLERWAAAWLAGVAESPRTRDSVAAYALEHNRLPPEFKP